MNDEDLRDFFAGLAMLGMLANQDSDNSKPASIFANASYTMADAMLEARKPKEKEDEERNQSKKS